MTSVPLRHQGGGRSGTSQLGVVGPRGGGEAGPRGAGADAGRQGQEALAACTCAGELGQALLGGHGSCLQGGHSAGWVTQAMPVTGTQEQTAACSGDRAGGPVPVRGRWGAGAEAGPPGVL